ncbi:hypothetical protein [Thiohalocapsa sp. ML1]|jgi:hypothetical protein|uniref:hypothetical protein n=1 Tax=Thiohalocapsa sp. ML1 TaxID=1431688 RepID=UPI0012E39D36|nr:hypothetical protein [Thiohalocapsa sp. ML1]
MTGFLERWANESPENARRVAQELLITEVTESLWEAMEQAGVKKSELANRMGATKGYVSRPLHKSGTAGDCSAAGPATANGPPHPGQAD